MTVTTTGKLRALEHIIVENRG